MKNDGANLPILTSPLSTADSVVTLPLPADGVWKKEAFSLKPSSFEEEHRSKCRLTGASCVVYKLILSEAFVLDNPWKSLNEWSFIN